VGSLMREKSLLSVFASFFPAGRRNKSRWTEVCKGLEAKGQLN